MALTFALALPLLLAPLGDERLVYEGGSGAGEGKRVVFVAGDDEYRSEEALPQLARILAIRHGFHCTVLFSLAEDGTIDPGRKDHLPGLEALEHADLMVIFTRFRDLPDEQMTHVAAYVEAGRPIVGLRTATHAFDIDAERRFARYGWRSREWDGGFGRRVLGETWIAHHGAHGTQSTRGRLAAAAAEHPILRGLADGDVWDPADVYTVRLPLPEGRRALVFGEVLDGMKPDAPRLRAPAADEDRVDPNDPAMPIAWVGEWTAPGGVRARVFTTTTGCAEALLSEGTRRLYVNACFWAIGLEEAIREDLDVSLVGAFDPSPFGFSAHREGVRPLDLAFP